MRQAPKGLKKRAVILGMMETGIHAWSTQIRGGMSNSSGQENKGRRKWQKAVKSSILTSTASGKKSLNKSKPRPSHITGDEKKQIKLTKAKQPKSQGESE